MARHGKLFRKGNTMTTHIRWLIKRDMPSVLAIENRCFPMPWLQEDFIAAMRCRNTIGMVCEANERVVGFMVYELHPHHLRLLNLAVEPLYQREQIGTEMVRKLTGKLSWERRRRVLLEVRETNLPAQLFFRSLGFRAKETLHDWYDDSDEDAYLFEYRCRPEPHELTNRIANQMAG